MREITIKLTDNRILLGREGEDSVLKIIFNLSEWKNELGDGVPQLILHPRKADPYPAALQKAEQGAEWIVTAADTQFSGKGTAQLIYILPSGKAKSKIFDSYVEKSLDLPEGAVPPGSPEQGWVDNVLQAAANVEIAQAHGPQIVDGFWHVWDFETGKYVNTNVRAEGSGEPGGGTSDYLDLRNKPSINDIELDGNKTADELKLQKKGNYATKEELATKANSADLPKNVSDLNNDSKFQTEEQVNANLAKKLNKEDVPDWAKQPTKPAYTADEVGALPADTHIPVKVSELLNDSGFLAKHQDISGKMDKNQGPQNAGKILGIGEGGNTVPVPVPKEPLADENVFGSVKTSATWAEGFDVPIAVDLSGSGQIFAKIPTRIDDSIAGKLDIKQAVEDAGKVATVDPAGNLTMQNLPPVSIPKMKPLTFIGGATGTYDGTEPLTVDIPAGGNSGGSGTGAGEEPWVELLNKEIVVGTPVNIVEESLASSNRYNQIKMSLVIHKAENEIGGGQPFLMCAGYQLGYYAVGSISLDKEHVRIDIEYRDEPIPETRIGISRSTSDSFMDRAIRDEKYQGYRKFSESDLGKFRITFYAAYQGKVAIKAYGKGVAK